MRKYLVYAIVIVVLAFIIGFYVYNRLPDTLASHWDEKGDVNGYMPKFWGVFLLPLLSVFLLLLFVFLPSIDPLKENYKKFASYYDMFIALLLFFLFYIYLLTLLWNLGYVFNMSSLMIPGLALLFFYIGFILQKSKRNWFIGIRNPWTLSSDYIWDKTNHLGGLLFKIAALFMLAGVIFPGAVICFVIIPLVILIIIVIIYSYQLFRKEKKAKTRQRKNK